MKYLLICLSILSMLITTSCNSREQEAGEQPGEEDQIAVDEDWESSFPSDNRQNFNRDSGTQNEITFQRLTEAGKTMDIQNWITQLRKLDRSPIWVTKEEGDFLFIYIGWGRKPTGGYNVEVTDVEVVDETEVVVRTAFNSPEPDIVLSQDTTHPYDLIKISRTGLPVRIEPEGSDPPRLMLTVTGIDQMEPIVAGSESIKLFSPQPGAAVQPGFEVTGIASVFEATVNYRILNANGEVVLEDFTTAYEAMNWGYFSFEPDRASFSDMDSGNEIYLELFTINARDGEEINRFKIPLTISL